VCSAPIIRRKQLPTTLIAFAATAEADPVFCTFICTRAELEFPMARLERPKGFLRKQLNTVWDVSPRVKRWSIAVGLVCFLVTDFMHYLLAPDLGRRWERLLAEFVSALVVGLLTAGLMNAINQLREATLLRMQVISEMNHHIRNALTAISLTAGSMENQQSIRVISESVDRIEWALREILLRNKPIPEKELDHLRYFPVLRARQRSNYRTQESTHEQHQGSL
jgi:signal transduction histidine kinase